MKNINVDRLSISSRNEGFCQFCSHAGGIPNKSSGKAQSSDVMDGERMY